MDSKIFRALVTFKKPYPILLGSPEDKLYLTSRFHDICLGSLEDVKPHIFSQTLSSHPNRNNVESVRKT